MRSIPHVFGFKLILASAIGLISFTITTQETPREPARFYCRGELSEFVPWIKRCDFRNDCKNWSDEKDCTRHPGARLPFPSDFDDQWYQDDIWTKGNESWELGDAYIWAKSTAGHIRKGAVTIGLTSSFQLTFICQIPQVYITRHRIKNLAIAGGLRPIYGDCALRHTLLRDYEIIIRAEDADVGCEVSSFQCAGDGKCFPSYFVCDGESDCKDGSDEDISMCRQKRNCTENEFPCSDGKCIPMVNHCVVNEGFKRARKPLTWTKCYDGKDHPDELFDQLPSQNLSRFKCSKGRPKTIPGIKRCDLRNDCQDKSDEKDCTRHPNTRRAYPREIEDQWMQGNIWSRSESSTPLAENSKRKSSYSGVLTYKRISNGSFFTVANTGRFFENQDPQSDSTLTNSYLLSSEPGEAYVWVKSTAGHVREGAVVAGLTSDFELTFLCRAPEVYLFRLGKKRNHPRPRVSILRPSKGICSFPKYKRRDYEVLVRAPDAPDFSCGVSAFHCTEQAQCIPYYFVCDGESDCKDGSDEDISMCRKKRNCLENEFPCSDGKCIPMENHCEVIELESSTGTLIVAKTRCYDGRDGSKELPTQLSRRELPWFKCTTGNPKTIPGIKRCDFRNDCKDGSDELDCTRHPGVPLPFPSNFDDQWNQDDIWPKPNETLELREGYTWAKSTAGHARKGTVVWGLHPVNYRLYIPCRIPQAYLDRHSILNSSFLGAINPGKGVCVSQHGELRDYETIIRAEDIDFICDESSFYCKEQNQCIPSYFVCDGESDCKGGSDESLSLCRKRRNCFENEFPCSDGKCIPMEKVCEIGYRANNTLWTWKYQLETTNCYDGMDESEETFEQFCRNDKFRCSNGHFAELFHRCNDRCYCIDCSDEINCTRHPELGRATPSQLKVGSWKKGFWMEFKDSFPQYLQLASSPLKAVKSFFSGRIENFYFRRAQHMYGIFNLQCNDNAQICNLYVTENRIISRAGSTDFQALLHTPEENQYAWVKSAKGHVPDGAVMLGLTSEYEPVFPCRKRAEPINRSFLEPRFGILIPSESKCRVVFNSASFNTLRENFIFHLEANNDFADYEILRDSAYWADNCSPGMFVCRNQKCIEPHFVCDGEWDCASGEDEETDHCRKRNNCSSEGFPCSDGKCIPMSLVCEGGSWDFGNCLDGNDESPRTCLNSDFQCFSDSHYKCTDGSCIVPNHICNGVWDCKDGGDESNCSALNIGQQACGDQAFRCNSGKCLDYIMYRCDSYFQCEDRSDEKSCGMGICNDPRVNCQRDPYKLDELGLKQGLWIPNHSGPDQYAVFDGQRFKDYSVCRLVDSTNGSSRTIIGTLKYERNGGRVLCIAGELLGLTPTEELPFDVLHEDSPGAVHWAGELIAPPTIHFMNKDYLQGKVPENMKAGVVVGGLTDDYEIFFICRRGFSDTFDVGALRPRFGICNGDRAFSYYNILHDIRYSMK